MSAKQAKLQGSVAAYLRCGGVVTNQIEKGLLPSLWVNLQSYKQERYRLVHFARLANTLLKDRESARNNHVLQAYICFY